MIASPLPRPLGVMLDLTSDEHGRIMAYAYRHRKSVDDAVRDATLTVVDAAARNKSPGVNDTRPTSASHSSGARTTREGLASSDENNRNRTPSRAAQAALPRGLGGKGVNPGSLVGDLAFLELLVDTLRESLRVRRGELLTDDVIEERSRNGAAAMAGAIDEVLDESAPV